MAPEEVAERAATYLETALVDGTHAVGAYDGQEYDDVGLTIDILWARLAAGHRVAAVAPIVEWLASPEVVGPYTGEVEDGVYAAATAKTGLAFHASGLSEQLASKQLATLMTLIAADGRLSDQSEFGDYSSPIGQALGILLLVTGSEGEAAGKAAAFLASQQCEDGGFPVAYPDSGETACESDLDTTALAVDALAVAGGQEEALTSAITFLAKEQGADGSWSSFGGPSTNTTALAAEAVELDSAHAKAASRAREWLASRQNDDGGLPVAGEGDSDPRATAQAVLALSGQGLLGVLGLVPAG